jgi:ActR/RegA family two-component response regulator
MSNSPHLLIVEPEYQVAADLERVAERRGCADVTLVSHALAALLWMSEHTPNLAIVRYQPTENDDRLMALLSDRGVRTVVCSEYPLGVATAPGAHFPWLETPAHPQAIWRALDAA